MKNRTKVTFVQVRGTFLPSVCRDDRPGDEHIHQANVNGPRTRRTNRKVMEMDEERSCGFLTGPANTSLKVAPAKWWFAISRDVLAKGYRRQMCRTRPAVSCHRTPTFSSPVKRVL